MAERDRLMDEIGTRLGLPRVTKGVGNSVHGDFIDPMTLAVGLDPQAYPNKYRRVQAVVEGLGGEYDRIQDTSEGSPSGGGGTRWRRPAPPRQGDHPRLGGEHGGLHGVRRDPRGTTPAWAGSTVRPSGRLPRPRDHPRLGGEHS